MLLRAILPDVLIDNFDVANFEKTDSRFDIYLDEKKVMLREDKKKRSVISYGFGDYRVIQDFPIRGRSAYLHVRNRKWLDKATGEIFSYEWELSEFDETRLNAFGKDMSLDETCLSNGEMYTILTNKAAHGGKGALAAMVRGVASDTVSAILKMVPREIRRKVVTVTTDLSSAMMLTVRTVFPKAKLINDRFHVQQLMTEAIDQMRIAFRWAVLAEENKAIKEHRAKRKAVHTRAEKDLIGEWEPERMANGETKPQIMARSRHILLMHKSKWNAQQLARAEILFQMFPDLKKAYNLYLDLVDIFNKNSKPGVARLNLARWYNDVEAFGYDGFSKVIETFENHNDTIINYFEDRLTNASAESFNAKIKAFRTQFRGVGDIRFFMYRLATLYS